MFDVCLAAHRMLNDGFATATVVIGVTFAAAGSVTILRLMAITARIDRLQTADDMSPHRRRQNEGTEGEQNEGHECGVRDGSDCRARAVGVRGGGAVGPNVPLRGDNPFWLLFGDIAYVLLHLTGIYDLLVAGSSILA